MRLQITLQTECDKPPALENGYSTRDGEVVFENEKVKYFCDLCNKQFTRQDQLKTHIQSVHEGVMYSCDQCGKQFTGQGYIKKQVSL